jgi:hypothetical protein
MGRVVVLTSQLIRDNTLLFFGLSLITALPSYFLRYEETLLPEDDVFSASYLIAVAVYIISDYLFGAAIAKAVIDIRSGHQPSPRASLEEIARDFYPLAAIAIIVSLVWVSASLLSDIYTLAWLLLIPGFLIFVPMTIIVPVRTIERPGFVASFVRSLALTSGHRLPIFGLVLAFFIASMMYEVIIYAAFSYTSLAELEDPGRAWVLCMVAADVVIAVISAALATVIYFELRFIKEGVVPEAVAAEFD